MQNQSTIIADIKALLRARNPLLWVVTQEEARVESYLMEAAANAGYVTRMWDIAQGVTEANGTIAINMGGQDPASVLSVIKSRSESAGERCVWVLRDMPVWLTDPIGSVVKRQLRNLARTLPTKARDNAQAIIIITPSTDVPKELANHTTVVEWPLPDKEEIGNILNNAVNSLPEEFKVNALKEGARELAIDAAVGLTGEEVQACYARSLVQYKCIDPAAVAQEKRRVIARERVLEWYDPLPGGLDAVGGLENLKEWLVSRASAYSKEARDYGLPPPKGALLVGIPGCGKSLTAKAVATAWGVPLLRLDLGALKAKFVGESEANLRRAFKVIESVGRCVVWLDEIEKSLQGATSGSSDGGVSSDALGGILSWMQERQGEAFVIATANDVSSLPPELLRKGRFDEVWFIDLPIQSERESILKTALKTYRREKIKINIKEVAESCTGFTGAEVAALLPDALYKSFSDEKREPNTRDLVEAAIAVTPLSKTAAEKISALRKWAEGRARYATRNTDTKAVGNKVKQSRNIDI